jgi:DNA gyrase/topoisomerase IV subunit A
MPEILCVLCRFDLRKAQARQHIVQGLLRALADLDKVVATVRAAKDGAAASKDLQQSFGLSPEQVCTPLVSLIT